MSDEQDFPKDEPLEPAIQAIEGEVLDAEEFEGETEEHHAKETHLRKMMTSNFMEYASYVIKDRAIPDVNDGLKPVQRRILHTLFIKDDGKYHKVANIVGECMKFHPHGDSSIYGALITIANKEYFIDRQGNFGNILTGDSASAARYIECRLTPLAREVLFNKEITEFLESYDGRNLEPVFLPAKVPALLMLGTDGIAVGMATKVLPHNFQELLKAQIDILRNRRIKLFPDFIQGGVMDVSEYQDGHGKVTLRAPIEKLNKKTLVIRHVPASCTTESLIHSIEEAVKKGKLKLSAINDYTAENVEIELQLVRGADPDQTIDALYAFTNCEVSISSNITVIQNKRPAVMSVSEVLFHNTQMLVDYLRWELEIKLDKLNEKFHLKTLEQIFIENRIYKRIEECKSEEEVFKAVHTGLAPFRHMLKRDVTDEDVEHLLRIPIRRISLFDMNKNQRDLDDILAAIEEVMNNLANLKDFTIAYIKDILKKYGKEYTRRTEIKNIEKVDKKAAALANVKVGLDRSKGYVGTDVSGSDFLKCTEFDRLLIVYRDGRYKVMDIPDKLFTGRFMDVFVVNKEQQYSVVYSEKKTGFSYYKTTKVDKFILDREYRICPKDTKLEVLETNYGIVLDCQLEEKARAKETSVEVVFDEECMRSPAAKGFKIGNRKVEKFLKKKRGSEKCPKTEAEELAEAEEQEEAKKKELGWRSATPIRFTAPKVEEAGEIPGSTGVPPVEDDAGSVDVPSAEEESIEVPESLGNTVVPTVEETIEEEDSVKEETAEEAPVEEEHAKACTTSSSPEAPKVEETPLKTKVDKKDKVRSALRSVPKSTKNKKKEASTDVKTKKEEVKEEKPKVEKKVPTESPVEKMLRLNATSPPPPDQDPIQPTLFGDDFELK